MNDQDWQVRALEVADHCRDVLDPERILTFAREYAAEALVEVERLKDEVGQYRAERNDLQSKLNHANDEVASLRAEVERLNEECAKWLKLSQDDGRTIANLRAQLAAAGPVKVPDEIDTAPIAHCDFDRVRANGWNACISEVLRLNASSKENG